MAIRTIPATTIRICDICYSENARSSRNAKMTLDQAALDHTGTPVANGGFAWDLCDKCAEAVVHGLLKTAEEIRKA